MKIKPEINTYCPTCRKHTTHKVKVASKGAARTMALGTRQHNRKLKGYGGKVAGEKTVKKMGKRQKLMLQCNVCKKKHERVMGGRTRVKIEIKA
ncbi:50S ribosomal protein L44e [Candidatus Burarchaeum australiense]|nr:50S ribosomal protein L44e [Candidatus Burarchaeum australiense]